MKKITLGLLITGFSGILMAQTNRVDTTFGVQGVVFTDLLNISSSPLGLNMNLLPNGKIIIAGQKNENLSIQQYENNGARDTTFISSEIHLRGYDCGSNFQQDGKLIACGPAPNAPYPVGVIRLEPDGTIDSTFGDAGIASGMITYVLYSNLFEQSDGKIVVFGALRTDLSQVPLAVTRLLPNGKLDSTFAQNGHFVLQISQDDDLLNAGLALPDGKLLFTGLSGNKILLLRLNSDGSPDNTFGSNGIVVDKSIQPAWAFDLTVQKDGKIVVTGYQITLNTAIIARYNADGSPDTDFGFNGIQYIQEAYKGVGVSIRTDGKIIAAIRGKQNSQEIAALVQLLPNGQRDLNFGQSGVFFSGIKQKVRNLTLSGNQVYVAAQTENYRNTILRFLLDLNVGTLSSDNSPDNSVWLYPNPISEHFTLQFGLTQRAPVNIYLYDMNGKLVETLVQNQCLEAGNQAMELACPAQFPSGNYVVTLEVAGIKRASVQVIKI